MSDWINVVTKPTRDALDDIDRRVDRATMWALREAGRAAKKAARNRAPVYRGFRRDVEKGRLKRSISSAKKFRRNGDALVLTVGPRGWRTILYAAKVERLHPYMAEALAEAGPALSEAAARGWRRAMERR